MLHTSLRFDLRAPTFSAGTTTLYRAALEMAEFADRHRFESIQLSEHHGTDDGYLPSPLVFAAGIAARTERIRLLLSAMVVPLHDPLRLAEDLAVLDQMSNGRVTLVAAGGYVASEFAMFDKDLQERGAAVAEVITTLRQAWSGEPFEFRGRRVRVTPTPAQSHLPVLMGGSVPAAARRAGRLADGFVTHIPELYQIYCDEARANGKTPAPFPVTVPGYTIVAEKPDAMWDAIAPHALHETNEYGKWQAESGTDSMYRSVDSAEELRAKGVYNVVTPQQCIELGKQYGSVLMHPLVGGLDPAIAWRSLELYVDKVLPAFRA